jgi:hypothetical protein
MTSRTSTARNSGRVVATLGIIGALVATSGGPLIAESNDSDARSGLVGTWAVQVTGRDCATNTPLGPPFNALITFHQGGTLSESPGSLAFAPNQRSAGHGVWTHEGRHTFSQRMIALILFDTPANLPGTPGFNPSLPVSPGFFAGWATVTTTVRLIDADHGMSAGTNEFFKADGTSYRTGCSTAVTQRFE